MKKLSNIKFLLLILFSVAFLSSPAMTDSAQAKAKGVSVSTDEIEANSQLKTYAMETMEKMNRLVIPSKKNKEIKQNTDGSWTARYTEVDVNSITTSVKKPEDTRYVQYVGYMRYVDVEYICKAESKEAAMAGPFTVRSKEGLTELVKYMKGKWGY